LVLALDEFLLLVVDLDLGLGLGRAGRGDPDGDFDMVLVLLALDRAGARAHVLGGSRRKPEMAAGTDAGVSAGLFARSC
jgi:hypothetical protein